MTFCVLAADEDDEGDIALQIHFTLIQAFCCENDIDIVRVGDVQRLAAIVGAGGDGAEAGAPGDLHCILISVSGRAPRIASPHTPGPAASQPRSPHSLLPCAPLQNPSEDTWKDPAREKLSLFCEESRSGNDWVPSITLPE